MGKRRGNHAICRLKSGGKAQHQVAERNTRISCASTSKGAATGCKATQVVQLRSNHHLWTPAALH